MLLCRTSQYDYEIVDGVVTRRAIPDRELRGSMRAINRRYVWDSERVVHEAASDALALDWLKARYSFRFVEGKVTEGV